jgi:hypothetical protein
VIEPAMKKITAVDAVIQISKGHGSTSAVAFAILCHLKFTPGQR